MKTIIEMAFEAGLVTNYGGRETASDKLLERFAALVAAHERERMAQKWEYVWSKDFRGVAKAIREEGQE